MKKIKVLSLLACLMVVFSGCHKEEEPNIPVSVRTVFMYLIADNDISDDIYNNIASVEEGLRTATSPGTFVIYWDGPSTNEFPMPTLFKYEVDGKGKVSQRVVIQTYTEQNSVDPAVMGQVFNDMKHLCPADSYGLIVGSHATGWLPVDRSKSRSLGDDSGFKMNIPQLAEVLTKSSIHFDYILMDACLMSQVEVAYELRYVADYLILSPAEVLSIGFPYMRIVKDLLATDDKKKRVIDVAKGFVEYYRNECAYNWATIGVIDSKEMEAVATITRSIISAHKTDLENFDVSNLQNYGRSSLKGSTFDFRDFISKLTAGNVPSSFDEQLNRTVIYKGSAGNYLFDINDDCFSGIGCYVPRVGYSNWNNYFKNLQWYSVSGWNETVW